MRNKRTIRLADLVIPQRTFTLLAVFCQAHNGIATDEAIALILEDFFRRKGPHLDWLEDKDPYIPPAQFEKPKAKKEATIQEIRTISTRDKEYEVVITD